MCSLGGKWGVFAVRSHLRLNIRKLYCAVRHSPLTENTMTCLYNETWCDFQSDNTVKSCHFLWTEATIRHWRDITLDVETDLIPKHTNLNIVSIERR